MPLGNNSQDRIIESDVTTDGNIYEQARDPPGQRCRYIPPGETRCESYRLSTFQKYPSDAPVNPRRLAACGFYFTGYKDRVKCFCCGNCVGNWVEGDDVRDDRWHKPDCKMMLGQDSENVPMGERLGFVDRSNLPTEQSSTSSNTSQENLERMFPCLNGVNPHMREEHLRLQTFDHRWPSSQVIITPERIAKAGFFFLGERDRVKCWYCNGGIQNWEPTDEPWEEHAKYFPTCEFLLRQKSPDFVYRIVAANPNISRPVLLRAPYPFLGNYSPFLQPPIIDHEVVRRKNQQKLPQAMESELVKKLETMGFESNKIGHYVERKLKQTGRMQDSMAKLSDVLGELLSSSDEDEMQPSKPQQKPAAIPASLQTKMKQIQEERRCKVCFDKEADVVFIPCGHLVCCIDCASCLRKCPICRNKIEKAIKTYV